MSNEENKKSMNRIDHISLVHKQLSNDISAEELVQLQDWINESEENKMIVESITQVWESAEMDDAQILLLAGEVDLDAEYALLNESFQTVEKPEAKVIPMWRMYIGLAAG
jgi:hypothetical protein